MAAISLQDMINSTGLQFIFDGTGANPISLQDVAFYTEVYEGNMSGPYSLDAIADDQNYNP